MKFELKGSLETGLWLISSDVTGESGGRVSYGPTSAIDPGCRVVSQVPVLQNGMILVDI